MQEEPQHGVSRCHSASLFLHQELVSSAGDAHEPSLVLHKQRDAAFLPK